MWFFKEHSHGSDYKIVSSEGKFVFNSEKSKVGVYYCYGEDEYAKHFIQPVEIIAFGNE